MLQSVCCNPESDLDDVYLEGQLGTVSAPSPVFAEDPISGSSYPDDNWTPEGLYCSRAVVHGKHLVNAANAQTPIPIEVGGGTPYGPIPKAPAMMGYGGDTVTQVLRSQRYPAIARIRPETTGTPGSVARQSYQYVREQMPDKRPFNAFGNPASPTGEPNRVVQIEDTIPPALEPPRYNYTGLDTEYILQQHDILQMKAAIAAEGL